MELSTVGREPVAGFCERLRIRVDAEYPSLGRKLVKDGACVSAQAEGGVEIEPPRVREDAPAPAKNRLMRSAASDKIISQALHLAAAGATVFRVSPSASSHPATPALK